MTVVFTRFDLGRQEFDKDINDITINDMFMVSGNTIHRAEAILFHDTTKTGNWKVLKFRGDGNINYNNMIINKYNKGVLIDLLTNEHG